MASILSGAPTKATKAGLARMLGVSRQAVSDLVRREILSEDKNGKIDIELARVALERVRPSGKTAQALTRPPAPDALPVTDPNGGTITSFHAAKALNETALAQMNQIKLKEMQAKLLEADKITRGAFQIARGVRDHLASRNRRISPNIAAETDVTKVQATLDDDDRILLANLMREFERLIGQPMEAQA